MPRYRNVAGIAREVSKRYLNVDGIAREISKGYKNIDGVAREYFSNGVVWEKFNCTRSVKSYGNYVEMPDHSQVGQQTELNTSPNVSRAYPEYSFSSSNGYKGEGTSVTMSTTGTSQLVGMYYLSKASGVSRVYELVSVIYNNSRLNLTCICRGYAQGEALSYTYQKGTTSYGTITLQEGEMPTEGTLIEGSIEDGYCVRKQGSTYYYYVKQQ